jgi:hypothetical protein
LRNLLAHTCVAALEPDLIILDEFQRFKNLLDPQLGVGVAPLSWTVFGFASLAA